MGRRKGRGRTIDKAIYPGEVTYSSDVARVELETAPERDVDRIPHELRQRRRQAGHGWTEPTPTSQAREREQAREAGRATGTAPRPDQGRQGPDRAATRTEDGKVQPGHRARPRPLTVAEVELGERARRQLGPPVVSAERNAVLKGGPLGHLELHQRVVDVAELPPAWLPAEV